MKSFRQSGFSLLEVLVAAFIVFLAITIFTSVYRSALLSSEKATNSLTSNALIGLVADKIAIKIKLNQERSEMRGTEVLVGNTYSWTAKVKQVARPHARYIGRELVKPEHQAKLWEVSVHNERSKQYFTYTEISW